MKTTGRLTGVEVGHSGTALILQIDHPHGLDEIRGIPLLDITITKHTNRRSRNANALLWACLGEIATALRADKWDIYLKMLRRYGQYTYVCVKPKAVEMMRRQWRESEVIGEISINGEKAVQMLCYYGSSTYDSKEFSVLLDGVISEMKEMGLQAPMPEEVKASLEAWEKARAVEKV